MKICKIKFYAQKNKSQISTSLLIKCNMNNFFSSRSGYNFLYTGPILHTEVHRENQQLQTRYCRERWDWKGLKWTWLTSHLRECKKTFILKVIQSCIINRPDCRYAEENGWMIYYSVILDFNFYWNGCHKLSNSTMHRTFQLQFIRFSDVNSSF